MNRTLLSAVASPSPSETSLSECNLQPTIGRTADGFDSVAASRIDPDFCLFSPVRYESGYAYPLFVWLHSDESSEYELGSVMPGLSVQNFVGVAPRATAPVSDDRNVFSWRQTAEHIEAAAEVVQETIRRAQERFHTNPQKVFLAGYGSGGQMALRLGLREPQRFAGILSVHGPVPSGGSLLGQIKQVRGKSVMLLGGTESRVYPPARVKRDVHLLHSAGMKVMQFHVPCGDELDTKMLAAMNCWIMEHVCSAPAPVPS